MSDDERPRVELRPVLDEQMRRSQVRQLFTATVACDVLVVAILAVGLSSGWSWWTLALALAIPLVVGAYALRAAVVLGRTERPGRSAGHSTGP